MALQAGDPLLWSQFETTKAAERLSTKVQKKARALTIEAKSTTAVGGWMRPNDHVDIIGTFKDPATNEQVAVTLMQNVIMLATGKITGTTNINLMPENERAYGHVSLLVLPEEAEILVLARSSATSPSPCATTRTSTSSRSAAAPPSAPCSPVSAPRCCSRSASTPSRSSAAPRPATPAALRQPRVSRRTMFAAIASLLLGGGTFFLTLVVMGVLGKAYETYQERYIVKSMNDLSDMFLFIDPAPDAGAQHRLA